MMSRISPPMPMYIVVLLLGDTLNDCFGGTVPQL
jgi:hypothetical protein